MSMPRGSIQESASLGAKLNRLVRRELRVWKRLLSPELKGPQEGHTQDKGLVGMFSDKDTKKDGGYMDSYGQVVDSDRQVVDSDAQGMESDVDYEEVPFTRLTQRRKTLQNVIMGCVLVLLALSAAIGVNMSRMKPFWIEPRGTSDVSYPTSDRAVGRGPFPYKKFFEHEINTVSGSESGSFANSREVAPNQGIEVAFPYTPNPKYGSPVFTSLLVNHTFGNSWGQPSLVTFSPPEGISFNKVVLKLHTTVDNVQYDRLAHIFVGGAEVWRTSTIEPSGRRRFSTFAKDVSIYKSLFQTETEVLFQLNNIVTDKLKGSFSVELYVEFYSAEPNILASDDDTSVEDTLSLGPIKKYTALSTTGGPSKVIPLVLQSSPSDAPTESLPSNTFSVTLPKLSKNTTRLRLAIFTSGNGNEEFWYTNVLDKYTSLFGGLLGHGPARFINVYFNDQKILSQTPHPVIFTGGIAPTLWNPVSNNAFDLKSNDLDISGLLPVLWEGHSNQSANSSQSTLRIEISNAIDEFQGGDSGVGNDWITSANLLTYESDDVVDANGEIRHIGHRDRGNVVGIAPPYAGTLQQIVNAILSAELTSVLSFELKDGSVLNTTFSYHTKGEVSNIQSYTKSGDIQNVIHVGHSVKSLLIVDNDLQEPEGVPLDGSVGTILQLNTSLSYPFTLQGVSTESSDSSTLDVYLVNVKDTEVNINDISSFTANAGQNGTAHFVMSDAGNSGSGALHVQYKLEASGQFQEYDNYKRVVDGKNLTIVSDFETSVEDDAVDSNVIDLENPESFADTLSYVLKSFPNEYSDGVNGLLQNDSLSEIENDFGSSQVKKLTRRFTDVFHEHFLNR